MRLKWFVLTAGLVMALQPRLAIAAVITNVAALDTNSAPKTAVQLAPSPQLRYTNLLTSSIPTLRGSQFRFNLPVAPAKPPASNSPAPGVYITEPYTCIVVVPDRHPDEASAVNPTQRTAPMPTIQPDVRLIPLRPK